MRIAWAAMWSKANSSPTLPMSAQQNKDAMSQRKYNEYSNSQPDSQPVEGGLSLTQILEADESDESQQGTGLSPSKMP